MPFTADDFFRTFSEYNAAIWPAQVVAYLMGVAVIALLAFQSRASTISVMLLLSTMWAMNAIAYHLQHFSVINPAARFFAILFLAQAAFLAAAPFIWRGIFSARPPITRLYVGAALILFALIGYPVVGFLAGHRYPAVPVFGVAPCPTTIFTIGVLLFGRASPTRWLLILPVIWAGIGGSAAVLLGIPQDYALIASGVIAIAFSVASSGKSEHAASREE